jgi:CRISPR/Cas system-associated exonuclease Cas4 (RecB family)
VQEMVIEFEGMCGHIDEYSNKLGVMLEKKSTSTYPSSIYPSHNIQAEYYFSVLKQLKFGAKYPYVVYFLKSMDPILPLLYDVNARGTSFVIDEMRAKRDIVLFFKKNGVLPPPLYSDECGDCPYPSLCFGNLPGVRE